MYRGRLVADADPASVTPEELGSAMTGAASGHLEHEGHQEHEAADAHARGEDR
jgi:simple sugar transport system ATP-binding protein